MFKISPFYDGSRWSLYEKDSLYFVSISAENFTPFLAEFMDQTLLTQLPFSVQNTGIILDLPKSRSKAQGDEARIIFPFFLSLSVASLMIC